MPRNVPTVSQFIMQLCCCY